MRSLNSSDSTMALARMPILTLSNLILKRERSAESRRAFFIEGIMLKVTSIEAVSKSRSKVYLDGEFAFVLYLGELREYGIREEGTLSRECYEEILKKVLPKRAKLRAMNLLQKKSYTEAQLYRKLKEGFYPEEVIEQALSYVASYHYTDDCRYAEEYISDHESTRSRMRIEQDLLAKGISKETLARAWRNWEEKGGELDEEAMIRALLSKRKFDPQSADRSELQKQYAFLMRKGFSAQTIRRVLKDAVDYD